MKDDGHNLRNRLMINDDNITKSIATIDNSLKIYSESLNKFKHYLTEIEKVKPVLDEYIFLDFKSQLNFSGFLTISLLDLLVISKNLILSKLNWEQLHQIRLGYLLIFAVIETYNIHGKYLKIASDKNSKLKRLFDLITGQLKEFKKQHDYPDAFVKIRNSTIGHIDPDYKNCYSILNDLEVMKAFQAVLDFMQVLNKLQEFCAENLATFRIRIGDKILSIEEFITKGTVQPKTSL